MTSGWGRSSLRGGVGAGGAGAMSEKGRAAAADRAVGSLGHRPHRTAAVAVAVPAFSNRRSAGRGRGRAGSQRGRGAAAGVGSFGHLCRPGAEPKAKRHKPEVILTSCN